MGANNLSRSAGLRLAGAAGGDTGDGMAAADGEVADGVATDGAAPVGAGVLSTGAAFVTR
jgi:hypothetical protein